MARLPPAGSVAPGPLLAACHEDGFRAAARDLGLRGPAGVLGCAAGGPDRPRSDSPGPAEWPGTGLVLARENGGGYRPKRSFLGVHPGGRPRRTPPHRRPRRAAHRRHPHSATSYIAPYQSSARRRGARGRLRAPRPLLGGRDPQHLRTSSCRTTRRPRRSRLPRSTGQENRGAMVRVHGGSTAGPQRPDPAFERQASSDRVPANMVD